MKRLRGRTAGETVASVAASRLECPRNTSRALDHVSLEIPGVPAGHVEGLVEQRAVHRFNEAVGASRVNSGRAMRLRGGRRTCRPRGDASAPANWADESRSKHAGGGA